MPAAHVDIRYAMLEQVWQYVNTLILMISHIHTAVARTIAVSGKSNHVATLKYETLNFVSSITHSVISNSEYIFFARIHLSAITIERFISACMRHDHSTMQINYHATIAVISCSLAIDSHIRQIFTNHVRRAHIIKNHPRIFIANVNLRISHCRRGVHVIIHRRIQSYILSDKFESMKFRLIIRINILLRWRKSLRCAYYFRSVSQEGISSYHSPLCTLSNRSHGSHRGLRSRCNFLTIHVHCYILSVESEMEVMQFTLRSGINSKLHITNLTTLVRKSNKRTSLF